LFRYLSGHPDIDKPLRKETEYFAGRYEEGPDWYRAHFPLERSLATPNRPRRVTFEATPDYLLDPRAASHAADLLPNARIIALLRDPAARAFSHYHHMVRLGFESLTFEQALDAEQDRCTEDWERITSDEGYRPRMLLRYSYVSRGHYAEQLTRWLDEYSRRAMHVVISEDLFADPRTVFDGILKFLELTPWRPSEMPNHSLSADTAKPLPAGLRDRLEAHYAPYNEQLRQLLGFDPGWGY